jgi:hypothetical protein
MFVFLFHVSLPSLLFHVAIKNNTAVSLKSSKNKEEEEEEEEEEKKPKL